MKMIRHLVDSQITKKIERVSSVFGKSQTDSQLPVINICFVHDFTTMEMTSVEMSRDEAERHIRDIRKALWGDEKRPKRGRPRSIRFCSCAHQFEDHNARDGSCLLDDCECEAFAPQPTKVGVA